MLCLAATHLLFIFYCCKGNLETGKKEGKIPSGHSEVNKDGGTHGHVGHVFAIAISSDGQYLVCLLFHLHDEQYLVQCVLRYFCVVVCRKMERCTQFALSISMHADIYPPAYETHIII